MPTSLLCAGCGSGIQPGNRFCSQCGARVLSCANCGQSIPEAALFCAGCGSSVSSATINQTSESQGSAPASPWDEVVQRLRLATLGEFEIGRELGRGAMAAVFLAHELSLDRKVAIKVMSPGLLMDEGMADRFRREAITIANLNHPNIVSVHSVRQAEGLHFFVMRYIRGRALDQVLQRAGRLPIPVVRSILYQVGSALTYAHRSRIVHRDIKPANILIDEDGNAVVTDFGIAKVGQRPSDTNPGALVGTPAYMSPEQCSGSEVSGASDQYSLGAVAYEMIAGACPFSGSIFTVMQAHLELSPQPIRDLCGDCPPDLEAAVLRMLEKDPAARWPSVAQAKTALDATPLAEDDPLLAELCRLATPDWSASLPGGWTPTTARTKPSIVRSARSVGGVRSVSILPPPEGLETGDSFMLVATVRGEHDMPLLDRAVQWATDTPEVLRIDSVRGEATAVAPGSARLTASCEGVRARLQVQVVPPVVDDAEVPPDAAVVAIQISAPPRSVKAGDSFVLTATPLDYRGGFLLGHTMQWSTSDVGVAVVTASGWVAALGPGPVVLKASCEGVSASVSFNVEARIASIKVSRPPSPQPPTRQPALQEHRPISRNRVSHSHRHQVLAISAGVVLLTSILWLYGKLRDRLGPDLHRPAATLAGVDSNASGSAPTEPVAAILRGAPASVTITRAPQGSLLPGGSTRIVAEIRDLAGQTIPGSALRWSSSDPRIVRIDSTTGRVRAVSPGHAWVIAALDDRRDSATIVIRRPAIAASQAESIAIFPHGSLAVGDTLTLAAAVVDGKRDRLASAEVVWSSSEPRLAAIDAASGQVRGYAPGNVTISARSGSRTARTQLSVVPVDVIADTPAVQGYEAEYDPPEETEQAAAPVSPVSSPEHRDADRQRLDAAIQIGVEQCYNALQSKNIGRVAELYRPATKSDEDKLSKLTRILRTEEWRAVVGKRVDGTRQLGTKAAAMEFRFELVWKDAFGGRLTSQPVFRAEFAKNGEEWEITSCRIVGSPKL